MTLSKLRVPAAFACALAASLALVLADGAVAGPKAPTYDGVKVSRKEASLIELGRRLFFDPLVSRSGARSCASCHDPDHGFSDPALVSADDIGNTVRHSQTILDSHLNPTAHWDGEFTSIEALVTARIGLPQGTKGSGHGAPLTGPVTVGGGGSSVAPGSPSISQPPTQPIDPSGTPTTRRDRGGGDGGYGPNDTTPPPVTPRTPDTTDKGDGDAPGGDVTPGGRDGDRSMRRDEPFDPLDLAKLPRVQDVLESNGRYASGFKSAFGSDSVTTARISKAIAAYCRSIRSTEAPIDRYLAGRKDAISDAAKRGYALFRGKAGCVKCHALKPKGATRAAFTDFDFHNTGIAFKALSPEAQKKLRKSDEFRILDRGRERISGRGRDLRSFKTATLRDLTRRGPYMHDGRFDTLAEVVRYYAGGGSKDPRQDKRIRGFDVTDAEVADLVAFLRSLTGETRPGLAPMRWDARPKQTRLRFVDAAGKPLPGVQVALHAVGDILPGHTARSAGVVRCTTDEKGWIQYVPGSRTHYRISLSDHLTVSEGGLVPDSCDKATVKVPVRGKSVLMVRVPIDKPMPEVLSLEHKGTLVLPGHARPSSKFVRTAKVDAGKVRTIRYEGWFRTDVPAQVVVRIPNERAHTERELTVTLKGKQVVTLDLTP